MDVRSASSLAHLPLVLSETSLFLTPRSLLSRQAHPTQILPGSEAQGSVQEALGLGSELLALLPAMAPPVAVSDIRQEALPLSDALQNCCARHCRVLLPCPSIIASAQAGQHLIYPLSLNPVGQVAS